MALLIKTHFKLAKTAIKENRTRSFLTCLGIAIGVASIILILSLMGSISNLVKNEINEIGSDLIVVRPSSTKDSITNIVEELTSSNTFQKSNLSISDVSAISELSDVTAAAPISAIMMISGEKRDAAHSTRVPRTIISHENSTPLTILSSDPCHMRISADS